MARTLLSSRITLLPLVLAPMHVVHERVIGTLFGVLTRWTPFVLLLPLAIWTVGLIPLPAWADAAPLSWESQDGTVVSDIKIVTDGSHVATIGTVIIPDGNAHIAIRGFDFYTGDRIWMHDVGYAGFNAVPWAISIDAGRVAIAGRLQDPQDLLRFFVQVYDATSGLLLWEDASLEHEATTIVGRNGKVFAGGRVPSQNGGNFVVRAYAANGGAILWTDTLASANFGIAIDLAADGDTVFALGIADNSVNGSDYVVRAYAAVDGGLIWSDRVYNGDFTREGKIAVSNGKVILAGRLQNATGNQDLRVRAYVANSGALLWENVIPDATFTGGLAAGNGRAYVIGWKAGKPFWVRAYDMSSGVVVWDYVQDENGVAVSVVEAGERVYTQGTNTDHPNKFVVKAHDAATGDQLWEDQLASVIGADHFTGQYIAVGLGGVVVVGRAVGVNDSLAMLVRAYEVPLPTLTVQSPNGGETWPVGSIESITWTSSGITGNVKIEISRNGGTSWAALIASTPNDGVHPWTVTGPATAQARVRITSLSDSTVGDVSNANAAIGRSITVQSPNGGEVWAIGSVQTLAWTSKGVVGNVKIEISRNGGTSWTGVMASTPNDGVHAWTVTGPATSQARVRITSLTDSTVADVSNVNATIGGGSITLISPNGGETWAIGSVQNVTWSSSGIVGNVRFEVSRNGGTTWATVLGNTPNDGVHAWTVTGPATSQARVRITSLTDSTVADVSNANATIGGGSITLISPNGGETWPIGGVQNIAWSSNGIVGKVRFEVSRNGGTTWTTVLGAMPNDGAHSWTVTAPATTQGRVRITSVTDPTVLGPTNGNIRIQ